MTTKVRFYCTQAHGIVARSLRIKIKGSGRAQGLLVLHHPATPPRIVLTQPFIICVSNEYVRHSTGPRERRGTRKAQGLTSLTTGVGNARHVEFDFNLGAYRRDPRIRHQVSEVTEKVNPAL